MEQVVGMSTDLWCICCVHAKSAQHTCTWQLWLWVRNCGCEFPPPSWLEGSHTGTLPLGVVMNKSSQWACALSTTAMIKGLLLKRDTFKVWSSNWYGPWKITINNFADEPLKLKSLAANKRNIYHVWCRTHQTANNLGNTLCSLVSQYYTPKYCHLWFTFCRYHIGKGFW